jgi:hypothetical protein
MHADGYGAGTVTRYVQRSCDIRRLACANLYAHVQREWLPPRYMPVVLTLRCIQDLDRFNVRFVAVKI